jgi:hypothetical protein
MHSWLKRVFRLAPQQQLAELESREPSLEERLERILRHLRNYGQRAPADLEALIQDLDVVMDILNNIITTLENIGGSERAKQLRSRLRNNRTRAKNALERLKEAS